MLQTVPGDAQVTRPGYRKGRCYDRAPSGCQGWGRGSIAGLAKPPRMAARRAFPVRGGGVFVAALALLTGAGEGARTAAAAQGRTGVLRCEATDNGERAEATVRVWPASAGEGDDPVASGPAGEALRVPAGRLRVEVRLAGTLDRRPQVEEVTISTGRITRRRFSFETGGLVVEVRDGDGRETTAMIRVLDQGGGRVGSATPGVPVRLGVGNYTLLVERLGQRKRVPRVTIRRGEEQTVVVRLDG